MAEPTITLPITRVRCANCAANIERTLRKVEGVQKTNVNFAAEEAAVEYVPTVTSVWWLGRRSHWGSSPLPIP
jgi:Cu+-exporting ATPase